jgi:hypothetical protein
MANVYFDKKSSWLYSKIDENDTEFTPEELLQFKGALIDLADFNLLVIMACIIF